MYLNTCRFKKVLIALMCSLMALLCLSSCVPQKKLNTIVLATTPWVGYYPLYYADAIGLDKQLGIDLKIIENLSIHDFRRAVVKNHIDGFACSMSEITQINQILEMPLELVLFTNFSNGADVIVANKNIATLQDLKGKLVGFQQYSLSHFVTIIALNSIGFTEEDIKHVEVKPSNANNMMTSGAIDAYVTYPPHSLQLLDSSENHIVFTSHNTPYKIVDNIVLKGDRGEQMTKDMRRLWATTMEHISVDPTGYHQFLAEQLGTSVEIAQEGLVGVEMLTWKQQSHFFENPEEIKEILQLACELTESTSLRCLRDLRNIHFGKVAG